MTQATLWLGDGLPASLGPAKPCLSAHRRVTELVESYYDYVWRALRRLGVSEAEADDAAQQVFLIASGKVDLIRPGSERPFLFQTAVRVASVHRRTRRRRRDAPLAKEFVLTELPDPSLGSDELVELRRARAQLDQILDEMEVELRAVFVLYELDQVTMAEISMVLGVPPGTVASRLRRARKVFYECVERLAEGVPMGDRENTRRE